MAEPETEGQEVDEEEEEYVMLDLDSVAQHIRIPENAPYVLTVISPPQGLDTLNPILVIDNKIKLIGEYTETIGTCLVFNESEAEPNVAEEEEVGPCEAKKINPAAQLTKILRFKPFLDSDVRDAASKPS